MTSPVRREIYAGVMSGTSLDGIDAVLADFSPGAAACTPMAATHIEFPAGLRSALLALQSAAEDEIVRAARAANTLADLYVHALRSVCMVANVKAHDVIAAGIHGQTVRHRPREGWTLQINNPARVAEHAYMTVVADFRSRDIAAGGQGAPLVPAFHEAVFGASVHRIIVNIGGIANLSDLPSNGDVRGFDTGPGNVLLDLWHAKHRGGAFDRDGAWARTGAVDASLLATFATEPYFALPPPKSTGRDLFDARWLDRALASRVVGPADVQATLVALTATSIANAVTSECPDAMEVYVCGGGARNSAIMEELSRRLAPRIVSPTSALGVPVDQVEALAFAWLARETIAGRPANLPAVTGARGPRVLGAVYPR